MDTNDLVPLLELLDDNIDELEESVQPLVKDALTDTASKLPLLDKAQLYILLTYAIESILYSYLRLNGVDAKEHAVYTEIKRVQQYFEKIKNVENVGSKRENMSLDKAAAGRIIKHAVGQNKSHKAPKSPFPDQPRQSTMPSNEATNGSANAAAIGQKDPNRQGRLGQDQKKRKRSERETSQDTGDRSPNGQNDVSEQSGPSPANGDTSQTSSVPNSSHMRHGQLVPLTKRQAKRLRKSESKHRLSRTNENLLSSTDQG